MSRPTKCRRILQNAYSSTEGPSKLAPGLYGMTKMNATIIDLCFLYQEGDDESDLEEMENRLTDKIDKANRNLEVLYLKMDRTEDMLTKILNKLDPPTRPPRGPRNLPRLETAPELPRVVRQLMVDGGQDAPQEEDEDESNI